MKVRSVAILAGIVGALLLVRIVIWPRIRAASNPVVVPFAQGLSIHSESGAVDLFVRQTDGTYADLEFGISGIHALLSSVSSLNQLLSAGLKNLAAGPAGPAGVGRQSQVLAIADLDGNGSLGAALGGGNVVAVYQGTSGLSFHSQMNYSVG